MGYNDLILGHGYTFTKRCKCHGVHTEVYDHPNNILQVRVHYRKIAKPVLIKEFNEIKWRGTLHNLTELDEKLQMAMAAQEII